MFNYLGAKLGRYGQEITPRTPLNNSIKLYEKTNKNDVQILTSFVDKKPFKRVSIFKTEVIPGIAERRAVLSEDLRTGKKTQINTDTFLNTIYHKEKFPNGRLQFSVSKVTIDKNGEQIEAKRDAYYKSADGKSWVHYISNDKPVIYNWNEWKQN